MYILNFLCCRRLFNSCRNRGTADEANANEKTAGSQPVGGQTGAQLHELPDEVLVKIFTYLPDCDVLTTYRVCRKWRQLCNNTVKYRKRSMVALIREDINMKHPFVKLVFKSKVLYPNVKFWTTTLDGDLTQFWNKLCPNLTDVIISDNDSIGHKSSHTNNKNWLQLFEKSRNLESLHLSLHISDNDDFLNKLKNLQKARFDNLRELCINGNISKELISFFDRTAPNLQSLRLLKFGKDPDLTNEITQFIHKRITTIKSLSFTDFPGDIFKSLVNLKELQLHNFKWNGRLAMSYDTVAVFLQTQRSLRYLELSLYKKIHLTECLMSLKEHVVRILVEEEQEVIPLNKINKFPNLEKLSVSAMFESILSFDNITANFHLTELNLRLSNNQQITKANMEDISSCFPNLIKLELKQCCSNALPVIFSELRQIQELKISIYNFSVFIPALNSISSLKKLKHLSLANCSTVVTDLIFIDRLEIEGLRKLELFNCGDNVSDNGIMGLVINCPAIECLNISCLKNITDEAIDIISSNLIGLEELNVRGCRRLTKKSLDFIYDECSNLRKLKLNPELKALAEKKFIYLERLHIS